MADKLNRIQLETLLHHVTFLPVLPATGEALWAVLGAIGSDRPAIEAAVEKVMALADRDPALLAHLLLRAGGSASSPVITAGQAAQAIGPERLLLEAADILVAQPAARPVSGTDPVRTEIVANARRVARAAQRLADQLPLPLDGQEAHACGLLSCLGRLALLELLPKSYARAYAYAAEGLADLDASEAEHLGVNGPLAGRLLARQWHLSAVLEHVIWLTGRAAAAIPPRTPGRQFILLTSLAQAAVAGDRDTAESLCAALRVSSETLEVIGLDQPLNDLPAQPEHAGPEQVDAARLPLRLALELARRAAAQVDATTLARAACYQRLAELLPSIAQSTSPIDAVVAAAKAIAQAEGLPAGGVVIAYLLDEEGPVATFVRCLGGDGRDARSVACREQSYQSAAVAQTGRGADLLRSLLARPAELSDWPDFTQHRHVPLYAAGRWLGGVLLPELDIAAPERPAVALLAGPVGAALGIVVSAERARQFSEALATAMEALVAARRRDADRRFDAALGDLAAGAAHELNNPLAVISGRAQLQASRAEDEATRQVWSNVAEQAQRASNLVSALMELASPPAPAIEAIDVHLLFTEAAETFASAAAAAQVSHSPVDIDVHGGTPAVRGDRQQVLRILQELLTNAAASEPRRICLAARADQLHQAVLLTVSDDGCGMDDVTLQRAFIPFFSRQKAGRRPGLGLPRVRRLVDNNGGLIWIDSTPGRGTRVFVRLAAAL